MSPALGRAVRRLAPGDRRVWAVALAVLLVLAAYGLLRLAREDQWVTGTNSQGAQTVVTQAPDGTRLCIPELQVAPRTGQVEVVIGFPAAPVRPGGRPKPIATPTLQAILRFEDRQGGRIPLRVPPIVNRGGQGYPLALPEPVGGDRVRPATLCLEPRGSAMDVLGSVPKPPWEAPVTIDGRPIPPTFQGQAGDATVIFKSALGDERSLLSRLPAAFERAALFRPPWIGTWTYWLIVLAGFPLLAYAAVRLLATAADTPVRRLVGGLAAVAFSLFSIWATVTPVYQGPDESEHVAYAQYWAETFKTTDRAPTSTPPYSSEQRRLIDGLHHPGVIQRPETRARWLERDEAVWRRQVRGPVPEDDGGGFSASGSSHTPAYYALLAPATWLTDGAELPTTLWFQRLVQALFGVVVVVCAALLVRELIPRHPIAWAAAGLLVAFQPMFGFMAGVVNNDMGVNAACALVLLGLVRMLRRGLTWRLGLGLAAGLVAAPLVKSSGYALFAPAAIAFGWVALQALRRRDVGVLKVLGGAFALLVGLQLLWSKVLASVVIGSGTGGSTLPGGGSATQLLVFQEPLLWLDYYWQTFVPWLPLKEELWAQEWPFFDVYVRRGFGSFGWVTWEFPTRVFEVVVLVLAGTAVLAVAAAVRHRAALRERWPAALALCVAILATLGAVAAAYVTRDLRVLPAEQGRYAFPAAVPLAALAVLGTFGLGRRWQPVLAAGLVAGMVGMGLAGVLVELTGFYT